MGDGLGWSTRRGLRPGLLVLALVLVACSDDGPSPGPGAFGTRCDEDTDCKSLICAGLEGDVKLCTEACTDPLGDECDEGFHCRRPDRKEDLVCVCTDPAGCAVSQPGGECEGSDECDDGIECTADVCFEGTCTSTIAPQLCAIGFSCDVSQGCVQNDACTGDFDCPESSDPCRTRGYCDLGVGLCQYGVTDEDGDGHYPVECGGDDCDDLEWSVAQGMTERCDVLDNDCDGSIDEGADAACDGVCSPSGGCSCGPSFTDCSRFGGGECVDVLNDRFNCGGCGIFCEGACENGACVDGTDCSNVICPNNSTCADPPTGIECRCNFGFEPNDSATECVDINECNRGFDACDRMTSVCVNRPGGFDCVCANGFRNIGMGCEDIDECSSGADCGNGVCQNQFGTFRCSCDPGYAPDPIDKVCKVENECQAGVLEDFAWCAGACRDLLNDSSFCGSCLNACEAGAFCSNGACACSNSSLTYCDGECVNAQSNILHCGECFNACSTGAGCVNGECFCPQGQTECGDRCVQLGTTSNCKACDDQCPSGAACTDDGCACPGGAPLACDLACVNPSDDELHCGECYRQCPSGSTCTAGDCVCPASAPELCEEPLSCHDFATSEQACGGCDNACAVVCNDGECGFAENAALGTGMGCILFEDGRVGCFGSNDSGRLGRGLSTSLTSQPIGLLALSDIEALSALAGHACALDGMGTLRCWGENGSQQLGNGNASDQASPVTTRTGVAQVAVGLAHTCVVLEAAGRVECIGSDALGQRGDGAGSPALGTWSGPSGLQQVDKLVSGANHLCALIDGEVFCWGDNSSGQLGLGTVSPGTSASAPGSKVTGLSNVTDLAAGLNHTCAIANGNVLCWGENSNMQSGSSNLADRTFATAVTGVTGATQVAAGGGHSCALSSTGAVACWGAGAYGQSFRWADTATPFGPQAQPGQVRAIAAGAAHGCLIAGSDFYCWGQGASITTPSDTVTPVRIPR